MYSSNFLQELKDLENFRDIKIRSIHLDSREVKEGGLFFAIKGHDKDGSDFISSALSNGASLIISDTYQDCLLYTSPSPRDQRGSRMPSSA